MRRLNKRGMDDKLMFVIWELIVVLMVVIVLEISVKGIANNTTYWKKYHSADLALMSDLVIANQGDFIINYDLKDLQKNFFENAIQNAMRIDPLKFQIFLKQDSYFIYDQSIEKDRFPQSFIFAKDKDVTIIQSNTSSDYIILYKKENNVGMKTNYISDTISCPSEPTKDDLSTRSFAVQGLSDETNEYGTYITERLKTIGSGTDKEALIALTTSTTGSTTIYYDQDRITSKKMACLIQRQLLQIYPDMSILSKQYDNSAEIEPFLGERGNYMYWVVINIDPSKITKLNMSDSMAKAIGEYYG